MGPLFITRSKICHIGRRITQSNEFVPTVKYHCTKKQIDNLAHRLEYKDGKL